MNLHNNVKTKNFPPTDKKKHKSHNTDKNYSHFHSVSIH